MLDPLHVVRLIEDNMRKYGLPFPMPSEAIYSWAKPIELPGRGPVMLYTGALYQLLPYIESIVEQLSTIEGSRMAGLALRLSGLLSSLGIAGVIIRPKGGTASYVEKVLRSIVRMLEAVELKPAYPYEDDLYSGILLYDLGLDSLFREHAAKVYKALKSRGAELIITVDPHTTHIMRSVYPNYVDGFDLKVKSYLEVLNERGYKPRTLRGGDIVVHDPCLYARFENVVDQPRALLRNAGFNVLEPRRSKRLTYCCGGPIEGLSPRMAKTIARERLEELGEKSNRVVTMCPICYGNLKIVAGDKVEIVDIALLLGEGG